MRTRALNAMTNHEISGYLKRKDVIFVPVGTVETHNPYPVDCEYVMAEAWAKLFAEQFDCLYLPNLMYLSSGGTDSICGTVKMSMTDSMKYLYAVSRSLLEQGFRRQVYIPAHGPSTLLAHPVIHQLFDDTKVPMLLLEPHALFAAKGLLPPFQMDFTKGRKFKTYSDGDGLGDHARMLGAYRIVGRLNDVPAGEEANVDGTLAEEGSVLNCWFPEHDILNECARVHAPAPFYYDHETQHAAGPLPETREELEREARLGETYMRDLVSRVDFNVHLDVLKRLQEHIRNKVVPVVGMEHLPVDRWSM